MPPTTKEQARRKLARASVLWGGVSLTGIGIWVGLTIWHLVRRGRVLRASLSNPRKVTLPEVGPREEKA